jgi:hypothetical protein
MINALGIGFIRSIGLYHFRAADASIRGDIWQVRWHGFSSSNGHDMPFTGAGDRNYGALRAVPDCAGAGERANFSLLSLEMLFARR